MTEPKHEFLMPAELFRQTVEKKMTIRVLNLLHRDDFNRFQVFCVIGKTVEFRSKGAWSTSKYCRKHICLIRGTQRASPHTKASHLPSVDR